MTKKLIYIVSEIDKSLHFEWVSKELNGPYDLKFILIGNPASHLEKFLTEQNIPAYPVKFKSKKDLPIVWWSVFKILLSEKPDIIHTHLWIANLIGLSAGWLLRIPKRIYTRHHAMIHYDEYPSGLKWDKLCNALATHIIAISENTYTILVNLDKAKASKVHLIPHGFDFSYFENVDADRIKSLKTKYSIDASKQPVIGVISRYTQLKGIQFIIPAFKQLLQHFPDAHLILANAHGDYENEIKHMLKDIAAGKYTEIRFENDLAALYRLFDIFIHVPVDATSEAFGQTYVEPLVIGVPSIFTKSGIAPRFVKHLQNAMVVDFRNSQQIYEAMLLVLKDETVRKTIIDGGKASVGEFTIEQYLARLNRIYSL